MCNHLLYSYYKTIKLILLILLASRYRKVFGYHKEVALFRVLRSLCFIEHQLNYLVIFLTISPCHAKPDFGETKDISTFEPVVKTL